MPGLMAGLKPGMKPGIVGRVEVIMGRRRQRAWSVEEKARIGAESAARTCGSLCVLTVSRRQAVP